MADRPYNAPLLISVEGGDLGPHEVRLNGELIGYRPWDGSMLEEVVSEVAGALAGLLGERLGWPQNDPEETR